MTAKSHIPAKEGKTAATVQPAYHIPALLPEALKALDIKPGGVYIDCTLGGGGHSRAIAAALAEAEAEQSPETPGRLLCMDQDMDAISRAKADPELGGNPTVTLVYGNFRYITNFARYYGVDGRVDGVLADLGVSFHHFDDPERGFSFRWPEGPLDMRMNRSARFTAADLLAEADVERLTDLFRLYGELPQAGRLARAIDDARRREPLTTSNQLLQAIEPVINPRQYKKELSQVFQALRIEVNDEIGALRQMLEGALRELRPGGRLVVITYHSLEDRLVKNFMRTGNLEGTVIKDFYGRQISGIKALNSKPIVASEAEIESNPRSRSAKMRVAVKL